MRGVQKRGKGIVHGVAEEPVECLAEGGAERADVIRPELAAEDVRQGQEAWECQRVLRKKSNESLIYQPSIRTNV